MESQQVVPRIIGKEAAFGYKLVPKSTSKDCIYFAVYFGEPIWTNDLEVLETSMYKLSFLITLGCSLPFIPITNDCWLQTNLCHIFSTLSSACSLHWLTNDDWALLGGDCQRRLSVAMGHWPGNGQRRHLRKREAQSRALEDVTRGHREKLCCFQVAALLLSVV